MYTDMTHRFIVSIASYLVGLATATTALAAPITFEFGGSVETITGTPPSPWDTVVIGDRWSIAFTFESTSPDYFPGSDVGAYDLAISHYELTIGSASESGAPTGGGIFLNVGTPPGNYDYKVFVHGVAPAPTTGFFLQLVDGAAPYPFSSDSLPLTQPDLAAFDGVMEFKLNPRAPFADPFLWGLGGSVTVPEPGTLALLGLGTACLGRARRHWQNCRKAVA